MLRYNPGLSKSKAWLFSSEHGWLTRRARISPRFGNVLAKRDTARGAAAAQPARAFSAIECSKCFRPTIVTHLKPAALAPKYLSASRRGLALSPTCLSRGKVVSTQMGCGRSTAKQAGAASPPTRWMKEGL